MKRITDKIFNLLGAIVMIALVTTLLEQPNVWDIELGPLERWTAPPRYPNATAATIGGIGSAFTSSLRAVAPR